MKRRHFIAALLAASLGSRAAFPQQPKVAVVGILVTGSLDPGPFLAAFKEELRRLGYQEGQNLRLEFRSAEGSAEALPKLARELVEGNVDVIVTLLTQAARAAKQATTRIPIVMAGAGDPVASGLVASLARPGGNITGMAGVTAELAGKNVELMRAMLPAAKRLVVLCNALDPFTKPFLEQIQRTATAEGFDVHPLMIQGSDEFERAFRGMNTGGVDGVIIQPSLPTRRGADLALELRLPSASPIDGFVRDGGLIAYSGRSSAQYRQAAAYVDKILKGTKPAELPIQQPTQFDIKINLRTAKALGLAVPPALLARADEVIE